MYDSFLPVENIIWTYCTCWNNDIFDNLQSFTFYTCWKIKISKKLLNTCHVCMYMLIFVFVDCSCLWGTGYSTGSTCTVCVPGVHACTVSKTWIFLQLKSTGIVREIYISTGITTDWIGNFCSLGFNRYMGEKDRGIFRHLFNR